jgi:hypothetical protein
VAGLNDPQYRTLLRSVAGVESCKSLDNPGVEDVMAVLEGMGFASHPGGPTYWRDKVDRRGSRVNERMVHLIRELAAGGRYDLAAMVRRQTGNRTDVVEQLLPREAWMLIEALKAINTRETAAGPRTGTASVQGRQPGKTPGGATDGASLF